MTSSYQRNRTILHISNNKILMRFRFVTIDIKVSCSCRQCDLNTIQFFGQRYLTSWNWNFFVSFQNSIPTTGQCGGETLAIYLILSFLWEMEPCLKGRPLSPQPVEVCRCNRHERIRDMWCRLTMPHTHLKMETKICMRREDAWNWSRWWDMRYGHVMIGKTFEQ